MQPLLLGPGIALEEKPRFEGIYLVGKTGSGKSAEMAMLAAQDARDGFGMVVLDPHGELVPLVASLLPPARHKDVILLDASVDDPVFGLNLLQHDGTDKGIERVANQTVQVFKLTWEAVSWGPRLEFLLTNLCLLLAYHRLTLADSLHVLYDKAYRRKLVAALPDPDLQLFWTHEYDAIPSPSQEERLVRASVMNKLGEFLNKPTLKRIVGQQQSTVDFAQAMAEGQIVLLRMPIGDLTAGVASLLGGAVVNQLLAATMGRTQLTELRPFTIYADEYHRYASPVFTALLNEARKYKVGTVLAHQNRQSQLGEIGKYVPLSAKTSLFFQLTSADAAELVLELDRTPDEDDEDEDEDEEEDEELVPLPPVGDVWGHLERNGHPTSAVMTDFRTLKRALDETERGFSQIRASTQQRSRDEGYKLSHIHPYPNEQQAYDRAKMLHQLDQIWIDHDPLPELRNLRELIEEACSRANTGEAVEPLLTEITEVVSVLRDPWRFSRDRLGEFPLGRPAFLDALRELLTIIQAEPVRPLDYREYRSVPQYKPYKPYKQKQTYQDKEEELVNDLVSLPDRVAYLKAPTAWGAVTYKISTPDLPQGTGFFPTPAGIPRQVLDAQRKEPLFYDHPEPKRQRATPPPGRS